MATPTWFRREIGNGDVGPDVDIVRRKLGMPPGPYDRSVAERIRGLAKAKKLDPTDTVTEEVAEVLGESEAVKAGLPPSWFVRPLERGDVGEDVRALRKALDLPDDNRFEHDCEAAVRRLQSSFTLETSGKVDEVLALLVGE